MMWPLALSPHHQESHSLTGKGLDELQPLFLLPSPNPEEHPRPHHSPTLLSACPYSRGWCILGSWTWFEFPQQS